MNITLILIEHRKLIRNKFYQSLGFIILKLLRLIKLKVTLFISEYILQREEHEANCYTKFLQILICVIFRRWKDAGVTNRTSIVIINLAISLVFLNVMLLISSSDNHSTENCTAIAILLHFSLLSTLMWCFVEATYICTAIVKVIFHKSFSETTQVVCEYVRIISIFLFLLL